MESIPASGNMIGERLVDNIEDSNSVWGICGIFFAGIFFSRKICGKKNVVGNLRDL